MGWHCPRVLWIPGFLLLLGYAALGIADHRLKDVFEPYLAFLGLAGLLIYGGWRRRGMALWLLLAVCAAQILTWWLAVADHPQWARANPDTERLARLFIFLAVAWWLRGNLRLVMLIWAVALAAFLATITLTPEGQASWMIGLAGERAGFGIQNNQHASMLLGVSLLGLLIFARRVCFHDGQWRPVRLALWALPTLIVVVGILFGQTRAVWLALMAALMVSLVAIGLHVRLVQAGRLVNRTTLLFALVVIALAVMAAWFYGDFLAVRALDEDQIPRQLLSGRWSEIPYSSVGTRIHTWIAASGWIAERPWQGWGSNGRELVIAHTPWLPEYVKIHFGHLHNFFIETWVNYGLLGLTLLAALVVWIGLVVWRGWRRGTIPNDVALFAIAFFCYWIIVNQFESYLSFWTGIYVHNLIVGGLVTLYWRASPLTRRIDRSVTSSEAEPGER